MRQVALDNERRSYAEKSEAYRLSVRRLQAIKTAIADETEAEIALAALDQTIAVCAGWFLEAQRILAAAMIAHVNAEAEASRGRTQLTEALGALGIAENFLSGKLRSERRTKDQESEAELSTISLSRLRKIAAHQSDLVAPNTKCNDW